MFIKLQYFGYFGCYYQTNKYINRINNQILNNKVINSSRMNFILLKQGVGKIKIGFTMPKLIFIEIKK